MIGIIGAMPEELEELLELLEHQHSDSSSGFTLYRGVLEGQRVLVAQCGIGKVNAAALTQLMIVQGARQIIFTGVAGAVDPQLKVGDIVVSRDALQHDVEVTALGYEPGQVPGETLYWQADETLCQLAQRAAASLDEVTVVTGRIASGDQFIASSEKVRWLRETFEASCAEMEGAATAQVCARAGIPFVIIRSISDSADHQAQISFQEFTPLAAKRAKRVVRAMVRSLPAAPEQ